MSGGFFNLYEKHTDNAKEHFITFYKEKGMEHIPPRVDLFKKKLGINPQRIRVMDLKNRWASRGRSGLRTYPKMFTKIDFNHFT